jgi:hypothetical protein
VSEPLPTRRTRKEAATPPVPTLPAAEAAALAAALPEAPAPASNEAADPERLPTAQLEMAAFGDHVIPYVPPAPPPPRSFAPWALAVAVIALLAALFTGWLVPLGVVAAVLALVSLRRPHDSRTLAGWALALALLSVAFSAGWLIWGFSQLAVV